MDPLLRGEDSISRQHVVALLPFLCGPEGSGGRIRTYHLLKGLLPQVSVTLVAGLGRPDDASDIEKLESDGFRVVGAPLAPSFGRLSTRERARKAFALARGRSSLIERYRTQGLQEALKQIAAESAPDVVLVDHLWMQPYAAILARGRRSRLIFSAHNVESQVLVRKHAIEGQSLLDRLEARALTRAEARMVSESDLTITVSEDDAARFRAMTGQGRIEVIPNGVDLETRQFLPAPSFEPLRLLFVGTYDYAPNADAALELAKEILPAIRGGSEGASLLLCGPDPKGALASLAGSKDISVLGRVRDLAPVYSQGSVVLVPLRYGGGSRLKILEAWAFGRPVIATKAALEGLPFEDGGNCLVAETTTEFRNGVHRLSMDPELADRLRTAARRLVVARHSWATLSQRFRDVVRELVALPGA